MTQPEQRQALVDTFINAIYLYDDKVLITFNYKEGTETVAFGEAVKAEKSSDMSARGAQIQSQDLKSFLLGKPHTFCTPFATFARIEGVSAHGLHSLLSLSLGCKPRISPSRSDRMLRHLHCSGIRVHLQGFIRIIFGFHRDGIAGDRKVRSFIIGKSPFYIQVTLKFGALLVASFGRCICYPFRLLCQKILKNCAHAPGRGA